MKEMIDVIYAAAQSQASNTTSILSPDVFMAVFGALFGGVLVKIVEGLLSKSGERSSLETQFRTELREEVDQLKRETDKWRDRYYKELERRLKIEDTVIENLGPDHEENN